MYDGVRGLFLPVLLLKHLEAWVVPGEGAEHPAPWCEPLAWMAGPLSALSEGGLWQEQDSGLLWILVGTVPAPWCFLHWHRVASRNRAEPGRNLC